MLPQSVLSFWETIRTGNEGPELLLDPNLKLWALIPISIVMILVGVAKQCIMVLVSPKSKTVPRVKLTEILYIAKARALMGNSSNLSTESFKMRQEYLAQVLADGKYLAIKPAKDEKTAMENPFTSPGMTDAMTSMALGNLVNYIPQTVIMWWVNYFFAGFVLMKLPFPLTIRFKQMLQSSVRTDDLDVRWVSSMSWYIISMGGLTPVYNVLFGGNRLSKLNVSAQQQQLSQSPGGPNPKDQMKALANDITVFQHISVLDNIEDRVLKLYS
ncbi:ER membrane complex subunit EMC3 [Kluyveromyces lactis]|uniref:ER membrane protein complex subunit 3 n=1 Tax=Kluyveromyces lactis (strain ATCC 8585 / CBS 2359 / DSM 70799 / NBRC 1267 / NRRL Y-1140 / WM37) TaxID=284590 RepID=Q6CV78_KLULA|nr:uncharacterized protein KLLA0_B14146g [Kluyveromyces lactis]CAH02554.1 KLLA0B14146p [Kluyveromyces lactis]|eukprot:XP_452161.1 uncharacterized protein KLLA0_B14146g [Kluyveromyces lactis]